MVYERKFQRDATRIYAKSISTPREQNYTLLRQNYTQGCRDSGVKLHVYLTLVKDRSERPDHIQFSLLLEDGRL